MNIHKILDLKFPDRKYSCKGQYPNHELAFHDGLVAPTEAELIAANDEMLAEAPLKECRACRRAAYELPGCQLGMLFDELLANGTISANGEWATHVAAIKAQFPKPGA